MSVARILVVDDEEANRRLLRAILEPLGYEVQEAADGDEALSSLAESTPDLVLLDLMMPRRDGYSVCREIKSDSRTRLVPVIILTTLDQMQDKLKAIELGADDFLNKPFHTLELTTRIRSLLSLKHFTDEFEHASGVLKSIALVVESRDRYTGDHCKRLGRYGTLVGRAMKVPDDDLKSLYLAGIFHDLGKIAVSDAVLNKPGRLTPDELVTMRSHQIGRASCRERVYSNV